MSSIGSRSPGEAASLQGVRAAVAGLGASGVAAAKLLQQRGATVLGMDSRSEVEAEAELRDCGIILQLGQADFADLDQVDVVVVSPGVPMTEQLANAEAQGILLVSEVEVASWFLEGRLAAVTGTNGKSTVTQLLGLMLQAREPQRTFTGGNLGTPLATAALADPAPELFAVELSSFQLERTETLRPHVAVLLPISRDHLDRYESFAHYAATKGRIFRNQKRGDVAIVAHGDEQTLSLARAGAGTVRSFGSGGDVCLIGDEIVDNTTGLRLDVGELRLSGEHNYHNACAAALAARELGVAKEAIAEVLRSFTGLPHRMEFVAEFDGISYYDDSKGTNVGASTAAILGVAGDRKVVLLAGGVDKGGSYKPLAEAMSLRGRSAVLFGEAAPLIADTFRASGVAFAVAEGLEDALSQARDRAQEGDVVLLSPACSSYDLFRNYRERGERFKQAVRSIAQVEGGASEGAGR